MGWLPQKVSQYFDAVCYGASLLLPEIRQANQVFLIEVYAALQKEAHITAFDIDHLETLIKLADRILLPTWNDIKSLIEAETYLIRQLPDLNPVAIRYCLEYLYHLFQRHGRIKPEVKVAIWRLIWRTVQRFQTREQALINDFIGWMLQNQFSPASILDRVRELHSFRGWMEAQGIESTDQITPERAFQYLYERGRSYQVNTCQKIRVHLQAFFDYYRERVDGRFPVFPPTHFRPASGHGMDANSDEVQRLWNTLKEGTLPEESALMLIFVLGMGLPLKVLPLLRLTEQPGRFVYEFQRPNRQGVSEYAVSLPLDEAWIATYWTAYLKIRTAPADYVYLFNSCTAIKKRQPISSDYCRRRLQNLVAKLLGYPIAVNRLERGSLKALAGRLGYDKFMERIQDVPLSNRTKLFLWFHRQNKSKRLIKSRLYSDKPKTKASRGKGTVNPCCFTDEDRYCPSFLTASK